MPLLHPQGTIIASNKTKKTSKTRNHKVNKLFALHTNIIMIEPFSWIVSKLMAINNRVQKCEATFPAWNVQDVKLLNTPMKSVCFFPSTVSLKLSRHYEHGTTTVAAQRVETKTKRQSTHLIRLYCNRTLRQNVNLLEKQQKKGDEAQGCIE